MTVLHVGEEMYGCIVHGTMGCNDGALMVLLFCLVYRSILLVFLLSAPGQILNRYFEVTIIFQLRGIKNGYH